MWILNTSIILESVSNKPFDGNVRISLFDKLIFANDMHFFPSSDGTVRVNLQIPISSSIPIEAWYPNGVGTNSQMLYQLTVTLQSQQETHNKSVKIGFRTIELIQDPVKPKGLTFYFKVNGMQFFVKGSNWIPAHVFTEELPVDYIRKLLQASKDANMNMLRVWGGGIYESDEFYEIADELGIMIWQDFMYACALYPTDPEFLASVNIETIQQVRRLQHHPSIAIWAGK